MRRMLSFALLGVVIVFGAASLLSEAPAQPIGGCLNGSVEDVGDVGGPARSIDRKGNGDGYVCATLFCRTTGSGREQCKWHIFADNTFGGAIAN